MTDWLILHYRPTTLFTLRMTHATSSGGKTLLVPSPYAFKLAMVDAAIRAKDVEFGRQIFELIKGRNVRFRPPERAVVNNTFIKILRKRELKKPDKDPLIAERQRKFVASNPFQSTIAYREFCYFEGTLSVALEVDGLEENLINTLAVVGAHVNYLGKRGSFVQFMKWERRNKLPDYFTLPANTFPEGPVDYGLGQFLDDVGAVDASDLFDRINTYSEKRVELNKHRILVHNLIPYRQLKSSRGYTEYVRCDILLKNQLTGIRHVKTQNHPQNPLHE
ncbi:hypothetical protein Desku_2973 [Desulfofundulus kuznetsovii DSM 6115]|uniref:CRISPR-associated protein Cas5 n=1 Tax=Desulfofundulus kuznetsovii (strain DSM 6115 / VKM B-1805 / 17) TaxID=760568 RepID=A0AAU8PK19_DESK7|nr:hypothetical protein Desku_2973 [Desulfofundulus kuznetsovii DSM 6115]